MGIRNSFHKKIAAAVAFVILMFLLTLSITGFIGKVRKNETAIADQTLLTAADNGVMLIQTIFDAYMSNIKNIAALYEKSENLIAEDSLDLLHELALDSGYDRLAVDYPNGVTYTSDGNIFDISDFGYVDQIKSGESFITDVLTAKADGKDVISFITPLHDAAGVPIAALRLTMRTTSMADVIDLTLFNSEGYYHLIDQNGRYVAAGESQNALLMEQNFFQAISVMEYDAGYSAEDIQQSFATGEAGFCRYSSDGNKRYAYCQPVGINNWVLMTIVPQEIIAKAEKQNIFFAIVMTAQLSAILLIIFAYIYLVQRKVRKTAVLNDECFRALAEQTSKVIFEWDFSSGKIVAMNNFKALFGREMVTKNSAEEALTIQMVHPEDAEKFKCVFEQILSGKNIENVQFRVRHASGEYHWCQLSGVVVFDHRKKPYKAIGSLEDIHVQVTNEVQMKHKSETDQLTGIYNKSATEQRIRNFLSGDPKRCALMIIDIDNFKHVNDSLGHQFGDRVLVEFADILRPYASESAIVGRIGGDEFFLFFETYVEEDDIIHNAKRICHLFARDYVKENQSCSVSASIGISFFPRDGEDFETLYNRADVALYRTKALGKNNYVVYDPGFGYEVNLRTKIDAPGQAICESGSDALALETTGES